MGIWKKLIVFFSLLMILKLILMPIQVSAVSDESKTTQSVSKDSKSKDSKDSKSKDSKDSKSKDSKDSKAKDSSKEGFNCSKSGFITDKFNKKVDDYKENDANMAEKFMTSQLQNLWNIGDINGLSTLVFGNPYCVWADGVFKDETKIKMASDGIFTLEEREKIIDPVMKMLSTSYVFLLVLAILLTGIKMGFGGINGRKISDFGEDLKMWFVSGLFILAYGVITNWLFQINAAFVLDIKDLLEKSKVKVDSFSIMASIDDLKSTFSVLSLVLVVVAEWILALILNFVYISRKVIVLILLILGYVAGYSLLFARTRGFFGVWIKELIGNVFLQSIHALVLFAMAMFASTGAGVIYKLGLMMMFIPLSGMISKWLNIGDSSTKLGSTLTMMGLGGVISTTMLASQAGNIIRGGSSFNRSSFDSNTVGNGSPGGPGGGGGLFTGNSFFGGSSLSTAGGGDDSSITSISTSAKGSTSNSWQAAKGVVSGTAGTIGGLAGMVAGPMGSTAARALGAKTGDMLMQAPRNMAFGAKSAINTLKDAKNYTGVGGTGIRGMLGDVSQRRATFANMGESLGAMVGQGGAGRNLGLALSGVSRQRLAATSPSLGGRGMIGADRKLVPSSFSQLAKQYPGAELKYVQTNMGSSMWVKGNDGQFSQVGLTGAADPLLKRGEMRVMDYKLADPSQNYALQPNGTYKMQQLREADSFSSMNHTGIDTAGANIKPFSNPETTTSIGPKPLSESSTLQVSHGTPNMESVSLGTTSDIGTGSGIKRDVEAPTTGLTGSTPAVMRTSGAYIVGGATVNGEITSQSLNKVTNPETPHYQDSRFNVNQINPDSFIAHNMPGIESRTGTDRVADSVQTSSQQFAKSGKNVRQAWSAMKRNSSKERSKHIV
ncbi:hypothetical protein [Rummeliibacillus stabekisii]|uniref:hypothetical protein n=1 Tax=Rummeliibacillus stabekisii TaxID=241244 RepID=UPI0037211970